MRLDLMRSLHRLTDEELLNENASQRVDSVESIVAPARRSAIDILHSHRADQLLTPVQQNLLSVIVDDINVIDPPRQSSRAGLFASDRGEAMLRLQSNSLTLLEELCETPLVFAVRQGDVDSVVALLKSGSDPDESDMENVSPLCHACEIQSLEIVRLLVDAGANVNHETRIGHRPLNIAQWHEKREGTSSTADQIIRLLVNSGATGQDPD